MIPAKIPVPPYAVTDGTYWPNGLGTIPLPVNFPDNGGTYIVITISNASGGDSLDTLVFGGIDLLGGAVPMVAGDDDQSADDIVAQVLANTGGDFDGTAAASGMTVIYRADGHGSGAGLSYTATTGAGTVISAVATRWVLQEFGNPGDGTYWLLDALAPGVYIPDITSFSSLEPQQWLYLPEFHTLHQVVAFSLAGLGLLSSDWGTHVFVQLTPPPGTSPTTLYPVMVMPPMIGGITIKNTGGVDGEINGYNFESTDIFDRSSQGQLLVTPLTYDSTGTQFAISTNG